MVAFLLAAVTVQSAYMAFGVEGSTNWEICYHASNYALIAAVAYEYADKYNAIFWGRSFLRFISFMWTYFLIHEVGFVNADYQVYKAAVMTDNLFFQMGIVLIAAMAIIAMDLIKKRI